MTEILPQIIKEITPLILETSKAIIEENASNFFTSYESKGNKNLKENVEDFIYENQDLWRSKLDKGKDVMFKYLKCDKQILLYNDYLEEKPTAQKIPKSQSIYNEWSRKEHLQQTSTRKIKNGNGNTIQ